MGSRCFVTGGMILGMDETASYEMTTATSYDGCLVGV